MTSAVSLTLLYDPIRPEPVEGLSIFNNFRSWFDKLTTNDESRDFWDTTLAKAAITELLKAEC